MGLGFRDFFSLVCIPMSIMTLPTPSDFPSSTIKSRRKSSVILNFSVNSYSKGFHLLHQHHQRIAIHHYNKTYLRRHHILSCSTSQTNNYSNPDNNNHLHQQAQEAISQFLQEFGLSVEESDSISVNCPKYTKMLIVSVQDLEEWNQWRNGDELKDGLVGDTGKFKEKVVVMAKEKGDNGKAAFLESVGLSLSSAIYFARYVQGESLMGLMHKVKYMKEMFFSDSDDNGSIGKIARKMLKCLSISTDDDVQRTLSFFEKIEARRGGLNMLGNSGTSFRFLVESFPRLLTLSVKYHLIPVVEFLQSSGIPKEIVGNVLLLFPPIIFFGAKGITTRLKNFEKVGAVNKDMVKMLQNYPWILSEGIQENYAVIHSFLESQKVPKESTDRAIRRLPYILGCSTSNMKLMVQEFGGLGIKHKVLGQVIARSPQLLLKKPQEFLEAVSFLENLGFDTETVGKILARCPEIFATSANKTLNRKIEFLSGLCITEDRLSRAIKKYPELLVSHVERTLLPRKKYLMDIGLSEKDIGSMVHRFSPLLGYSIDEVLRPKYEFLVNTMEKPVSDVVYYPRYFSYSLEKKIKPRFLALKQRNIECSLKDMLGKNDEDFASEFMDND